MTDPLPYWPDDPRHERPRYDEQLFMAESYGFPLLRAGAEGLSDRCACSTLALGGLSAPAGRSDDVDTERNDG